LWDAEGLVKEFGDGGLFLRDVVVGLVGSVITVKSTVGGALNRAGQSLSRQR